MPEVKVALVTTRRDEKRSLLGHEDYGLLIAGTALEERGFYKIGLFPKFDKDAGAYTPRIISEQVAKFLKDSEIPVIGISVLSDLYPQYRRLLEKLENAVPGALFVGGGPHFAIEDWEYTDSIKHEVGGRLHAVNYGHCEPFIGLCEGLRDGSITWNGRLDGDLPKGLYTCDGDGIRGEGVGGLPDSEMPVAWTHFLGSGRALVYNNGKCPNRCDYCSCLGGEARVGDGTFQYLLEAQDIDPDLIINIIDSNPFAIRGEIDFLKRMQRKGIGLRKYIYLDDSSLAGDGWEEIVETCKEYRITGLFIGRETASKETAKMMGRNLLGSPRTQDVLDTSYEGLRRFAEAMPDGTNFRVAYIITPWETPKTARRIADEIIELESMRAVDCVVNGLVPHVKSTF